MVYEPMSAISVAYVLMVLSTRVDDPIGPLLYGIRPNRTSTLWLTSYRDLYGGHTTGWTDWWSMVDTTNPQPYSREEKIGSL